MTDIPASELILDELSRVNRKMRALFDARVKETGLTLSRARALFVLSRNDSLNQRELAEELDIETPTLVRLLDGMEKQGFIERRPVKGDRRAKRIVMTSKGLEAASVVNRLAYDLRDDFLHGLDEVEMRRMLQVLQIVTANVSRSCKAWCETAAVDRRA